MMQESSTTPPPNVVVICMDTVRKDYYDEFACRLRDMATVRYEEMRASASWSVPSHASMITGNLPHETGVHTYRRRIDAIDTSETWLNSFKRNGYRTIGISANVYAGPVFGFDSFFDEFVAISPSRRFPKGMDVQQHIYDRTGDGVRSHLDFLEKAVGHDHPVQSVLNGVLLKVDDAMAHSRFKKPLDYGGRSVARTLAKRIDQSSEPVLAFANFMDAHGPHEPFRGLDAELYDCPSSFSTRQYEDWNVSTAEELGDYETEVGRLRELYTAEIEYLDRVVSEAIEEIQAKTDNDTVFVVTADHGENLGYETDEYMLHHTSSLSEALLHVPFDIVSSRHELDTVTEFTSHRDLGRLLDAIRMGEALPDITQDRTFAEIAGSGGGLPDDGDNEYWDRSQRVAYADDRKYVLDELGNRRVFDVSGGPSEQTALPDAEFRDDLFDRFGDWIQERSYEQDDVDDAIKDRLRDLGYA